MPQDEIADQLLEIFTYESIDEYMEEFTEFVKNFQIQGIKNSHDPDFYLRDIQTIFGRFQAKFRLKRFAITVNGWNFTLICSIYKNDEQNVILKNYLTNKRRESKLEKKPKQNADWARLYNCYYPKK